MADINISSDLTPAGTIISVDGKKPKGEITNVYFSLYYSCPTCSCGSCDPCAPPPPPIPCVTLSYDVREEGEDGVVKTTSSRIEKVGDDVTVNDCIDKTITSENIVDFLVAKMTGKI